MKRITEYAITVLMTFLPARYRVSGTELRGAAIASGLLEFKLSLSALVIVAIQSLQARTVLDPTTVTVQGGTNIPGSGIFLLAEFWMNPLHILLFYFSMEGIVRAIAALASHQVLGTLPLYAISVFHNAIDRRALERELGPLIPDEIVRSLDGRHGYDLKVYSCRPKLNWNPYMTVAFEGQFYQMFDEEPGNSPRRFVYYLRKHPVGRVVVVIDHYTADTALKPAPDKWSGTPTLISDRRTICDD